MLADLLVNPDLHALGDPWSVWKSLRQEQPVAWTREPDGPGFWSVVRFDDGARVLRDWRTFSSARGTTLEGNRWDDDPASGQMLPLLDPPRHDALRRVMAPFLARHRLAAIEHDCHQHLEVLLQDCTEQRCFDASEALATPLPMHVSCTLLGVPTEDERALLPVIRGSLSYDETERAHADAELLMYVSDLLDTRRRRPADDLLSAVAAVDLGEGPMSEDALLLTFTNLLSAGLTTTRLAISGAIHAFLTYPAQWQRLRDDPSLADVAVEEILRWTSPSLATLRTATEPVTLGGQAIASGDRVAVWLPSMNRDEAVFEQADRFLVDHPRPHHLSFGIGLHACVGMALARMELGALVAALPRRWARITGNGPVTRLRSLVLHGIDQLPVQVWPV